MTDKNENIQVSGIDSKLMRVVLTVVTVLMLFVGPTYLPYLLSEVLKIDYFASISIGAVLFIVGLLMLVYLIRQKVVE
jgi:hypothetical protein